MDLSSLNPQQRLAVESTEGPLLVLAGAGTGKTRVITFRIAHLIDLGVAPEEVLAVTFTNKAAREMRDRLAELVGKSVGQRVMIGTFHAFCLQVLRQNGKAIGVSPDFQIVSGTDQRDLARDAIKMAGIDPSAYSPMRLLSSVSRLKNAGITPAQAFEDAHGAQQRLVAFAQLRYQRALERLEAVDFDDLILLSLRLMREKAYIRDQLCARFRYVLVDEYQDTNKPQYDLVASLTRDSRNVCAVGDDDQGIYSFRGARLENLLDFERDFPEVRIVALTTNYRSTAPILKAAHAVVRKNPQRREKELVSHIGEGARVCLIEAAHEEDEARRLAEIVHKRHFEQGVPFSDIALIFRTRAQPRPFETAFNEREIPYRMAGLHSFFDKKEIKDFLAYLRVLGRPDDDLPWFRVLAFPPKRIGLQSRTRIAEMAQRSKQSVASLLKKPVAAGLPGRLCRALQRPLACIEAARAQLGPGQLHQAVRSLMDSLGFRQGLLAESGQDEGRRRWDFVLEQLEDLETKEKRRDIKSLSAYLDYLALEAHDKQKKEDDSERVTFITIHASKGLEYGEVFLPGVEEGLLPHKRAVEEGGEAAIEEERRLCYVGMTRARRQLNLSYCKTRRSGALQTPAQPSRFLADIPGELMTRPLKPDRKQMFAAIWQKLGRGPEH